MRNSSRKALHGHITVKIDDELLARVDALAEQQDRPRGWTVRWLMLRTLERMQAEQNQTRQVAPVETTTAA
jgi:predicted transcriptional regulator